MTATQKKKKVAKMSVFSADESGEDYHEIINHDCPNENENSISWTEDVLGSYESSCMPELPERHIYSPIGKVSKPGTHPCIHLHLLYTRVQFMCEFLHFLKQCP